MVARAGDGPSNQVYLPGKTQTQQIRTDRVATPGETSSAPKPPQAPVTMPGQGSQNNVTARVGGGFNPNGWTMPSTTRGGPAPNGQEMAASLKKILDALMVHEPPLEPSLLQPIADKLKAILDRIGEMTKGQEQPATTDPQAPSDSQAPDVQGTDASQDAGSGNDVQQPEGTDAGNEAEGSEGAGGADEAGDAESGVGGAEGSSDETDRPENGGEGVETEGDPAAPGDQGVTFSETTPTPRPEAEDANANLARIQDKHIQRLLENLLGNRLYEDLLKALSQKH
ncbi:MAG: hypothetical protein ACAI44_17550 [Candidatus Sericytochromatia bacterium]